MTKDFLYSILKEYIQKGYLTEHHTEEKFSIFYFLKTGYIGFVHDNDENYELKEIKGALLSDIETEVVIKTKSDSAISFLCCQDESSITFSKELFKKCNSSIGRFRLKSRIKTFVGTNEYSKNDSNNIIWPNHITSILGEFVIGELFKEKLQCLKGYRKTLKSFKIVLIAMLVCFCLGMVSLLTNDWREQFDKDKPSVKFDKNATEEAYSHIEADMLIHFATFSSGKLGSENNSFSTYYLWGNSKTKEYGVVKFKDSISEYEVFSDDEQQSLILKEPITLYGTTENIPNNINSIVEHHLKPEISLPGNNYGTNLYPSDLLTDDNVKNAFEFFENQGITIEESSKLGEIYIVATTTPEKTPVLLNRIIDGLFWVFVIPFSVFIIILFIFAFKAEISLAYAHDVEKNLEMIKIMFDIHEKHYTKVE